MSRLKRAYIRVDEEISEELEKAVKLGTVLDVKHNTVGDYYNILYFIPDNLEWEFNKE